MQPGVSQLEHIVVLMMENRSFDHMLGGMQKENAQIEGPPSGCAIPGADAKPAKFELKAKYRGQLTPDPGHHFIDVHQQLFNGENTAAPNMRGFVQNYFKFQADADHARNVMYGFKPDQLPVLTALVREFAVFNGWFSSVPGPTLCNRAFAHYGTSFGQAGMAWWYATKPVKSIYDRMVAGGKSAKVYYYDQQSSTLEVPNLLKNQPTVFGLYRDFLQSCKDGILPNYSFIEPNYTDHTTEDGLAILASDQHPDHHVLEGERFIASIYNAIRSNEDLWKKTALLITYDEHGGIFDHKVPPSCTPDGYESDPTETGGVPFKFDRLGVRVPAVLVSPWVPKGTVVPSTRVFEHASIPATVTEKFLGTYDDRTPREKSAETFLDLLSLSSPRKGGFLFGEV